LTINNSSSSGVTLNKSQTVINNLTLVDGIVYTSSSNILSLNNGSTSSIGSDTAHVDGPIKKVGNSAFTFPTGDKGVWARIQIIPVAGFDATTEISVEYIFSAAPYPSNLGLAINHVSFTEYWEIALISDPGNDATCNVTMYFNNMIRSGIVNSGIDITTTHYEGALWENKGGSFVDNYNNTGYITSTIPLTTYSPETIASSNGMSPLPIELLEFNAISTEFGIEIEWVTSSEKNNDYFTLERSVDGKKWVTIYTIRGVGNTNTIHEYNYTDKEKYPEYLYYRLKQNDFDGNFSYSKVISVNTTSILFPVFSSNYDKDSKQIRIFCIEEYQSKIEFIELINSLGQKVYKSNTFISKIDVTKFPKGIYYVYCKYPQSFSANRLFID